MNKKQLSIIWLTLLLLTSMVWFPGWWFDYIIEGYPVIKPESMEFLVRIFAPIVSVAIIFIYLLRDKKGALEDDSSMKRAGLSWSYIVKLSLFVSACLLMGMLLGYFMLKPRVNTEQITSKESKRFQLQHDEFRDFCKREGYKDEVEALTNWLKEKEVHEIAILYNVDYAYSADIYKNFSQKLKDEKVKIVFSDMFKQGEKSFYSRLKIIETLKPAAIIFLGTYEERMAFLEGISYRSEMAFWKSRLDKIKWIE